MPCTLDLALAIDDVPMLLTTLWCDKPSSMAALDTEAMGALNWLHRSPFARCLITSPPAYTIFIGGIAYPFLVVH